MTLTLEDIKELVSGTLHGSGDVSIVGVSSIETAGEGEIAALDAQRVLEQLPHCKASALIVSEKLASHCEGRPHIVVAQPQVALNAVIMRLGLRPEKDVVGIHPTAWIHPEAQVGKDCAIGAFVAIAKGVVVGNGCRLRPHAVLEQESVLGERCLVHSQAVVCSRCTLGNDVVIGRSAVIGAQGFGFDTGPQGITRLHHIGTVEIGDRAEIGSGTTIDRARFGVTYIGHDVKLDNQVHIGHNCSLGPFTILAAQVGLAGSTTIGARCMIGGQSGLAGHLKLTDGVTLAAKAGVAHDIDTPGQYFGYWAKDARTGLREEASLRRLPKALRDLKNLRNEVERLSALLAQEESQEESV